MRNLITTSFLFLAVFGSAQSIPLLTTDKEWIIYYWGFIHSLDNGVQTYWFKETQDTVDEVPIFELMYNTPIYPDPIRSQRYFKEKNGKVTQVYNNGTEELFYDFNVQVGDTIVRYPDHPFFNLVVVKIDTVVFDDNKPRKRIHLRCEAEDHIISHWVEGIGNEGAFLYNGMCSIIDAPILQLRCYYENEKLIYRSPDVTNCIIVSTDNLSPSQLTIFPNPASTDMTISAPMSSTFMIYNLAGQMIMTGIVGNEKIDVSSLYPGLYLVKITGKNGTVYSHKLIKE